MSQPPGLPSYPPPRPAWTPPPPLPVRRGWLWAAIATSVVATLAIGALLAANVLTWTQDIPSLLNTGKVMAAVNRECSTMTSTVDSILVTGDPESQAGALADQNDAVLSMVDELRALPDRVRESDEPLDAWLDDWESLVEAREQYAEKLLAGRRAVFEVPLDDDGDEIWERMDFAAEPDCSVPETLLSPYAGGTSRV